MTEDVEITDNEFLRQFELEIGDQMARIEYSLQEVKNREISLVPTSPEVAGFMRKNRRKYKDLLPVGINI